MPQDGPKIVPRALLAALGRSWNALGPFLAALGRSWLAHGASSADLGASWGDLGAIWERSWAAKRGSWGDLTAQRGDLLSRGRRHSAAGWSPLREFLRKFLTSRDLKNLLLFRDLRVSPSTRRAALGAADLERPAGGDRRPLRKGSSACSMCEAGVV